jgi:hypothetical protein
VRLILSLLLEVRRWNTYDILSVGTIFIQGFVHDVPGVTLALVMSDFALDAR